jgi:hypothetical protein
MFASRARNDQQAEEPDPGQHEDQARAWGLDGYIGIGDRHDVSVADAQGRSNASAS